MTLAARLLPYADRRDADGPPHRGADEPHADASRLIPALTRLRDALARSMLHRDHQPLRMTTRSCKRRSPRASAWATEQLVVLLETAADLPRDYRWPMLLANLETQFEHFPCRGDRGLRESDAIRPERGSRPRRPRGAARVRMTRRQLHEPTAHLQIAVDGKIVELRAAPGAQRRRRLRDRARRRRRATRSSFLPSRR